MEAPVAAFFRELGFPIDAGLSIGEHLGEYGDDYARGAALGTKHGSMIVGDTATFELTPLHEPTERIIPQNRHLGYNVAKGAAVVGREAVIGLASSGTANAWANGSRSAGYGVWAFRGYEGADVVRGGIGTYKSARKGDWSGAAFNGGLTVLSGIGLKGSFAAPASVAQIRAVDVAGLEAVSSRQLAEFGTAITDSGRASWLYGQIAKHGVNVDLNFGPLRRNGSGVIAGEFNRAGRITINARAQTSTLEAVGTFGHEARHALDFARGLPMNTRASEYRAFVEEFIVLEGRAPNRMEMGGIARAVNHLYPSLPADARVLRISDY